MNNGVKISVSVVVGGQSVEVINGIGNLPDDLNKLKAREVIKDGAIHVAMEVDPDLMMVKIKEAVVSELRAMADKIDNG